MKKYSVVLLLVMVSTLQLFGQKAIKNAEFVIISVYEPPQSDLLKTAAQLQPIQSDLARKLSDMKNMGMIVEISAAPATAAELRHLTSSTLKSAADVLNAVNSDGWVLRSAYSQEMHGFPMHVFVLYRKKKKK